VDGKHSSTSDTPFPQVTLFPSACCYCVCDCFRFAIEALITHALSLIFYVVPFSFPCFYVPLLTFRSAFLFFLLPILVFSSVIHFYSSLLTFNLTSLMVHSFFFSLLFLYICPTYRNSSLFQLMLIWYLFIPVSHYNPLQNYNHKIINLNRCFYFRILRILQRLLFSRNQNLVDII
jgi:hypothetical protein